LSDGGRLRIALCADGLSPHTQRWANGLVDRGLDVAVVWAGDDLAGADLSPYRASISHDAYVRPTPVRRPWLLPFAPATARRLARRLDPDLAHGLFLSGYGWTAHALRVRPLVLSALGSDVLDLRRDEAASFPAGPATAYGVWRTRAAVAAADLVLADSEAIAAVVRRRVPGTATDIVRFGTELTSPPPEARSRWRQRLAVEQDAFVLLSSRLVRPRYNIDTIIRAIPAVRRRLPSSVLVLKEVERFAEPEYRRRCLRLVDDLGLGDAVHVVGELEREELLELYTAADVYVSVPDTDGTAVSVLEAMAARVAVVASDAPGIDPTIMRRGETASLVPPRDAEALAAAVVELGLNPHERERLVERAYEIVRTHGNFDRELDRVGDLYRRLVEARRRR
jgi:glycosyltransferase involved in cell wall biosynthesis